MFPETRSQRFQQRYAPAPAIDSLESFPTFMSALDRDEAVQQLLSYRDEWEKIDDHNPCTTVTTHAEQRKNERAYWRRQTPEARLDAVERLRLEAGKLLYE